MFRLRNNIKLKRIKGCITTLLFFFNNVSLLFVLFFVSHANSAICALIYPQKYGVEGRFKSLLYHTNGVYFYEGYYMNPTYIEFSENEKINTIYIPKAEAWSIKPNNNRLFLTPVGEDADTKMTVMTDKRTYFFELHARVPNGPFDPDVAFFVKFRYPSSASNKSNNGSSGDDGSIIQYIVNKGPDLSKAENFNFNYTVSGDYIITPIKIFDDGRFTYFEFRDKNGIIPAIFSVDSEGFESIVNFRIVNQYLAVEGVNSVYTLRHGTETVCVFNETMRGLVKSLTTKK